MAFHTAARLTPSFWLMASPDRGTPFWALSRASTSSRSMVIRPFRSTFFLLYPASSLFVNRSVFIVDNFQIVNYT